MGSQAKAYFEVHKLYNKIAFKVDQESISCA